jgi:predicted  nucleic acid-binding Zn-ribbon protein
MTSLNDAVKRLDTALGLLEASFNWRLDAERRRGDLTTELEVMQDDRARLALELESAQSRLHRVEAATGDVTKRVDRAVGSIRDALARAEAAPSER